MMVIEIPTDRISDVESFHTVFAELMGFPDFYGRNMAAWVDCMSSVDDPESGMTSVTVKEGEVLTLKLVSYPSFRDRCPDLLNDLVEEAVFVNWRRIESGLPPLVALAFYD
ncbi:MAG: barstar family protein [Actinomycetota bacterium]|nr:barstar family protein [Actinomycetota bacterium]